MGSSALIVLISVDLPEPDGPHTTTTSPLRMVVEQSFSTWKLPYHLETFLSSIICFIPHSLAARGQRMMAILRCRRFTADESAKHMMKYTTAASR